MAVVFLLLIIYLFIMFIIVNTKKDISIGNFTWGGGCLLLTWYTFFTLSSYHPRQILVTFFITLWGLRLAYYVWLRYKKGTDPRYVAWLESWHNPIKAFIFSFCWVIILNGFFAIIMALPAMIINYFPNKIPLNSLDYIGIALWTIGFVIESMSDDQMYIFKKDPHNENKILDSGLWHYSRHPNYFGEIMLWWGIYFLALSIFFYGLLSIIAPLAITFTLLFITGIPWAEKAMKNVPGYQEYKKRTSILIPWFVKK